MCGSPDVWSSTRSFAGCRSDSSLTPDRETSRIREITAKASLGGEPPHSPPSSRGAESNVTLICRRFRRQWVRLTRPLLELNQPEVADGRVPTLGAIADALRANDDETNAPLEF